MNKLLRRNRGFLYLVILFLLPLAAYNKVAAQAPVITSFSPTSGAAGTTVIIQGSNFSSLATNNIVYFGTVQASIVSASANSLTVIAPANTTYQPISVTTAGLTAYSAKPFVITYTCENPIFSPHSFVVSGLYPTGVAPNDIAIGDLDGDGKLEIVTPNQTSNTVSVLRNTSTSGNINFSSKVDFPTFASPYRVELGDIDGDGKLDIALTNSGVPGSVSILRNTSTTGNLSFAAGINFFVDAGPRGIAIGDLDGDGKPEVATANIIGNTVSILKNVSTIGTITLALDRSTRTSGTPRGVTISDLDGDSKPDVAVAGGGGGPDNAFISIFRNVSTPGTFSFERRVDFLTADAPTDIKAGDLDGDSKADLAVASSFNRLSVHRNTSSFGLFSFERSNYNTFGNAQGVAITDLDGDNKVDLATAGSGGGAVAVFKNESAPGSISFPVRWHYTTNSVPEQIAAGDLDGDGRPDLASANTFFSNNVSVLRNQIFCGTCIPTTFIQDPSIVLDASCSDNDGNITVIPTSGVAPFMYSIDSGITYVPGPATGYTFMELNAGTYGIRIKDINDCESEIVTREIRKVYGSPTFVNDATIVLDASCHGNDGSISIIPTCGAGPFMYSIDGGKTYVQGPATGYSFQGLAANTYQLRLKDSSGNESAIVSREVRPNVYGPCQQSIAKAMLHQGSAVAEEAAMSMNIKTFPNPSRGRFQLQLQGFGSTIEVQVFDAIGRLVKNLSLTSGETNNLNIDLSGKAKGLYLVRVVGKKGAQVQTVSIQ